MKLVIEAKKNLNITRYVCINSLKFWVLMAFIDP